MICDSFVFQAFVVEIFKIVFLWLLHGRTLIACPTALIVYSVVISSSTSSCIESLFIILHEESVWIPVIVIVTSLPMNIATGIYEAMVCDTLCFIFIEWLH